MMKAFISITLLVLLVASNATQLRFMASNDNDDSIIPTLKKCQHDDLDACSTILSKNFGGSDNAHCGSLPTESALTEWTEDRFGLFCQIKESCFKKSSGDMNGLSVIRVITEENYLKTIDLLEKISGESTIAKIGEGRRRDMMNPKTYGAWACQSWAQLSTVDNKSVFNAHGFIYDTTENACILVVESKADFVVKVSQDKVDGITGLKSCNVREQDFKFSKLESTSTILTTCLKNPKAKECKIVDNLNDFSDPAVCSVLGSPSTTTDCVTSDDVASKCFSSKKQVKLPMSRKTTGSDATSIRSFLFSLDGGESIALKAGFSLGNVEGLGARPKMLIPEFSGEVACRNLLQMTDNYGKPIMDVQKYDMFFYHSKDQTCSFFLKEDYDNAQEEDSDDGRYVEGPVFC